MVKEQLSGRIVNIVLKAIREEKGRLTAISDLSVINRQEFDVEGLQKMRLDRFIRVGSAMAVMMPRKRYEQMKQEISEVFWNAIESMENGEELNGNEDDADNN